MSISDRYADTFVRLADDLEGYIEDGMTYEDVVAGYEDAPDRDHLYRYAYLYWHDDDAPPTVHAYHSLDRAQESAREDAFSPDSRFPIAILDLLEAEAYKVNVTVTFDRVTSQNPSCPCGCGLAHPCYVEAMDRADRERGEVTP